MADSPVDHRAGDQAGGDEKGGGQKALDQKSGKTSTAFRTIGELSRETGLPQHILRYWETRFPQLRPLQRAGNRRYYRPEDARLVRKIDALLNRDGYTVRGVQQLLTKEAGDDVATPIDTLRAIRDLLARALAEDGV
ncbi:MerR family transcriptional regulator [Sphingomonas ginsenosidivorax]|uniref:MerR family transcriptional regulator n=1 Tax=Sphingomonas ginsenosidivorax TaxID=862135 RepID=A0A5C6UIC7_9SPHN|nr:MerR family transcriptional regulator [Sphingomonas ginsenosidivorax]TXC72553.1 MerR family transcriptional regulator [Sphingomonas ginsenosidivorax]